MMWRWWMTGLALGFPGSFSHSIEFMRAHMPIDPAVSPLQVCAAAFEAMP